MFKKKSAKSSSSAQGKFEQYIDPTGEFTNRELKLAKWYLEHKLLLRKIGLGLLVAWCIVTVGYGLIGWGYYLFFGYQQDRKMAISQRLGFQDYASLQPMYKAQDLKVADPRVFKSATDRYDFATHITNPNERWQAKLSYKYVFNGGETPIKQTILLPKDSRPVVYFGYEYTSFPDNAQLVLEAIEWQHFSAHKISDLNDFLASRLKFSMENFSFTPASPAQDIPSHMIEFDLANNSVYSYWEPEFYVELFDSNRAVGIINLLADQFKAGETRHIDIRSWLDDFYVTDVNIYPVLNIFDQGQYMEVQS